MPPAHSSDGASRSIGPEPVAAARENSSIPAPRSVMPAASTRVGPTRSARRLATCVNATMVNDIGAKVSPARSGERPSARWT